MAVHGRPRATEDLDVLVRATSANSARVFAALAAFGAPVGPHGVDANTFGSEGPAYRIGMKPLRIEVLTKISGVSFDEAASDPIHADVDGRVVPVIGRQALLKNKRSAGRHKTSMMLSGSSITVVNREAVEEEHGEPAPTQTVPGRARPSPMARGERGEPR